MLCNNAKVGVSVSFSFSVWFFLEGGGGGLECRKNSGCLRGGGGAQRINEGNPGGCTNFIYGLLQILPAHPR